MTDHINGKETGATVLGPVDLLVLEFPGNNFKGEILRNLHELVAAGTARIIDLVIITKNHENNISALNLHELGPGVNDALVALQVSFNQLITMDDIAAIGEQLETNSTAGILLFENVWAIKTKQAMLDANGRLLHFERIPSEVVQEAMAEIAAMSGQVA